MRRNKIRKVGITTTIPLEPILASGSVAVDLNNTFISSGNPNKLVEDAQVKGYPRNICTWIKGLHSASDFTDAVVGVVRGDCSNTESLLSALKRDGKEVHPFSYPFSRDRDELESEIESLCSFLGTDMDRAKDEAPFLRELRDLALELDRINWKEGGLDPVDVHLVLLSASDLDGDPSGWMKSTRNLIDGSREPSESTEGPRLGYIGVPPIISDLFSRLHGMGAEIVFFETERQFSMPARTGDWIEDYLRYTYPYDISGRVDDIRNEVNRRDIDGLIHYVQSFCHRQIDDMIFRKEFDLPILTLEGNLPGPTDERTLIRMEAFLDILEEGS
jgi:benzoyl-CoA reductase/2-hydroxyglutaryl-CoA dehydratase subunit BcrC/BadD/HgdB